MDLVLGLIGIQRRQDLPITEKKIKRAKVNFEIEGIHEEDLDLRRKKNKPCQTILYVRIVCDSSVLLLSSGAKHLSHSGLTCQRQQLKGRIFCSCSFVLTWLVPYIFWALLCIIIIIFLMLFRSCVVLSSSHFLTILFVNTVSNQSPGSGQLPVFFYSRGHSIGS